MQPRGAAPSRGRPPKLGLVAPTGATPYGASTPRRGQRRFAIATLVVLHALAVVGLLNASRLRDIAPEAKPVFLAVVDAPVAMAAVPARPLPAPASRMPSLPQLTLPLIAPEPSPSPSPSPSPVVAQAATPAPPAAAVTVTVDAAPAPAPAPSLPKAIPPSAVQYLVPPAPVYSRISAKMRESGKVLVRVYIDEAGMPRNVQLAVSTGFGRLDDAALTAVRNCRFRPYLENGVAVAGWAVIPIEFELPA